MPDEVVANWGVGEGEGVQIRDDDVGFDLILSRPGGRGTILNSATLTPEQAWKIGDHLMRRARVRMQLGGEGGHLIPESVAQRYSERADAYWEVAAEAWRRLCRRG